MLRGEILETALPRNIAVMAEIGMVANADWDQKMLFVCLFLCMCFVFEMQNGNIFLFGWKWCSREGKIDSREEELE